MLMKGGGEEERQKEKKERKRKNGPKERKAQLRDLEDGGF